uniref:Uncharacterized protein n=1 Tax=Amphimedon queenslandica TaxID=400682 RepID=A0A1X7U5B8_AMPQE
MIMLILEDVSDTMNLKGEFCWKASLEELKRKRTEKLSELSGNRLFIIGVLKGDTEKKYRMITYQYMSQERSDSEEESTYRVHSPLWKSNDSAFISSPIAILRVTRDKGKRPQHHLPAEGLKKVLFDESSDDCWSLDEDN